MPPTSFDRDEALTLLRKLVAVRSYPGEELAAQQLIAAWLAGNGMDPELQPTPNRQPNVIARGQWPRPNAAAEWPYRYSSRSRWLGV
jgi:hypothetical protein